MSTSPERRQAPRRRILVVANETAESPALLDTILATADEASAIMVVAPALNTRLRYWMSDDLVARAAAKKRLVNCLAALRSAGMSAEGCVGDPDPLVAMRDMLSVFPADEIIIATHPERRSNWLARGLPEHAREAFRQSILHVVVETATDSTRAAA